MDVEKMKAFKFDQNDFFRDVEQEQQAIILQSGSQKKLESGEFLFHEGNSAKSCYFVLEGRLKLIKLHGKGKETIIRYIGPGELAAVMAVFRDSKYPVSAEAVGNTKVVFWNRKSILTLIHEYPSLAVNILKIAFDRLDDIQRRYQELCSEQVDQRIARSLLRIMNQSGKKTEKGIAIDFPLSRQEIAEYTGTTLYTVSRVLSTWEKKGWVKSKREHITVTDPHALVLFSDNQ